MKKSKQSKQLPGSPTWLLPACVAVLIGCVALVFCQVLFFQFLPFWDDDTNIHRNPLYSPLSWESVGIFWKGPFQQLYIPVTYTTWAALVAFSRVIAGTGISVGPINPVLFHGANLTTHLLSAWMVFLIFRMLFSAKYGKTSLSPDRILYASLAGALFFALHPIQVESVSWVSGLRDLLGGGLFADGHCPFSWMAGFSTQSACKMDKVGRGYSFPTAGIRFQARECCDSWIGAPLRRVVAHDAEAPVDSAVLPPALVCSFLHDGGDDIEVPTCR